MSEYSEKLKDPRWQKVRLKVLERAQWKCECCEDSETTLHVHHLLYEKGKEPWDANMDLLECLCEDCHVFREDFNAEFGRKYIPTSVCMGVWSAVEYLNDNYMEVCRHVRHASRDLNASPWWLYVLKASELQWPKSIYSYVNGKLVKCEPKKEETAFMPTI